MTEQQSPNVRSLQVSAPGKLVLWGEYAVLVGARAGVLAVDRFATCTITTNSTAHSTGHSTGHAANPGWQLSTTGFVSKPINLETTWFTSKRAPDPAHPGALLWHAARANDWHPREGAQIQIDSSAFYQNPSKGAPQLQPPVKLGLGSSAAVCTALTHLCAALSAKDSTPATNLLTFPKALSAHRAAQQGAGSGIDIAASTLGGLLGFELSAAGPSAQPIPWPDNLHWQAFWTGSPASTTDHLSRFDAWRARGASSALTELVEASNHCSERLDLTTLAHYVAALRRFDGDSEVGIYAQGHEDLHKLAGDIGVIYKPCGAGGGDLGVAFAADPAQLQRFAAVAEAANIVQIRLEMAKHGVTTQAGDHQPHP